MCSSAFCECIYIPSLPRTQTLIVLLPPECSRPPSCARASSHAHAHAHCSVTARVLTPAPLRTGIVPRSRPRSLFCHRPSAHARPFAHGHRPTLTPTLIVLSPPECSRPPPCARALSHTFPREPCVSELNAN